MPASKQHKGYYERWFLPHYDIPNACQFITYRLGDSLPASKVKELNDLAPEQRTPSMQAYLDAGLGQCYLRHPSIAAIIEENLLHFHKKRYDLLAWVVMPNHVHTLIRVYQGYPLAKIVWSWKSFTAKAANKELGRTGDFWMPDYFDRSARNENELQEIANYIEYNPVSAGLVSKPEDWRFSSAGYRRDPS
jgi:REP element-mobilizing transposase RayT